MVEYSPLIVSSHSTLPHRHVTLAYLLRLALNAKHPTLTPSSLCPPNLPPTHTANSDPQALDCSTHTPSKRPRGSTRNVLRENVPRRAGRKTHGVARCDLRQRVVVERVPAVSLGLDMGYGALVLVSDRLELSTVGVWWGFAL